MVLTQTGEYAIRAMAYLALLDRGRAVRAAELSAATRVPVHYLSKVMRRLVLAGLVDARKGHGGGFALARAPERVRFSDVLEAVGEELRSRHCAFGYERCDAARPCPLHHTWLELQQACTNWATRTTLADVRGAAAPEALVKLGRRPGARPPRG